MSNIVEETIKDICTPVDRPVTEEERIRGQQLLEEIRLLNDEIEESIQRLTKRFMEILAEIKEEKKDDRRTNK